MCCGLGIAMQSDCGPGSPPQGCKFSIRSRVHAARLASVCRGAHFRAMLARFACQARKDSPRLRGAFIFRCAPLPGPSERAPHNFFSMAASGDDTIHRLVMGCDRYARPGKVLGALHSAGIAALLVTKPKPTATTLWADFESLEALEAATGIIPSLPKKLRAKERAREVLQGDAAAAVRKASGRWAERVAGGGSAHRGSVEGPPTAKRARGEGAKEPGRSVHDVVTPLYRVAYPEQLRVKQCDIMRALRAAGREMVKDSIGVLRSKHRRTKAAAATDEEAKSMLPEWLEPGQRSALPCAVHRILPSPHTTEFRNKVTFTLSRDETGAPLAGYRQGGFGEGAGCLVADPTNSINTHPTARAVAGVVTDFLRGSPLQVYDLALHTGVWRSVTVRTSTSHPECMVIMAASPPAAHVPLTTDSVAPAVTTPDSLRTIADVELNARAYKVLLENAARPAHSKAVLRVQASQQAALELLTSAVEAPDTADKGVQLLQKAELEVLYAAELQRLQTLLLEADLPAAASLVLPADYASDAGELAEHKEAQDRFLAKHAAVAQGAPADEQPQHTSGNKRYWCLNMAAAGERQGVAQRRFVYPAEPSAPSGAPALATPRVTSLYVQEYSSLSVPSDNSGFRHLAGSASLQQRLQGLTFHVSPSAFFQTNIGGTEVLYDQVREWAGVTPDTVLLDVCCGTGTIGLSVGAGAVSTTPSPDSEPHSTGFVPNSRQPVAEGDPGAPAAPAVSGAPSLGTLAVARLVGVELDAGAVKDAVANAAANGITSGAHFLASRAEHAMKCVVNLATTEDPAALASQIEQASAAIAGGGQGNLDSLAAPEGVASSEGPSRRIVALLDPPRAGLHKAVLLALRQCKAVDRLVYVSCNPTGSFVADAAALCAVGGGYHSRRPGHPFQLVKAVPVDLFPHTPHTELVAVFERAPQVPEATAPPDSGMH